MRAANRVSSSQSSKKRGRENDCLYFSCDFDFVLCVRTRAKLRQEYVVVVRCGCAHASLLSHLQEIETLQPIKTEWTRVALTIWPVLREDTI